MVERQDFYLTIRPDQIRDVNRTSLRLDHRPGREAVGPLAGQRAADAASLHPADRAFDHPVIGGLAVLPQSDAEQPLPIVVDEIPNFPSPLGSEVRFVAGENESVVRLSS